MKKRKRYDSAFKARVALEAIKEQKTMSQLASEFKVHANQIGMWKKEMLLKLPHLFEKEFETREADDSQKLYEQIGRQKVEIDFLKKNFGNFS